MKKTIFTLAVASFMFVMILGGCQSSEKKVENAQDKVQDAENNLKEANQALNMAIRDSIRLFKSESETTISTYEKNIADIKIKIAKANKENRAAYEKNLATLEQKNTEMKRKIEAFREDENAKWASFRREFNHDMDELGKALKDFTIKNK